MKKLFMMTAIAGMCVLPASAKDWPGFSRGMGIGGWLTNYKRFNVLPEKRRLPITIGDLEHFDSYITESDIANIKQMGFDHVRLGFDQIVMEESPYKYRERTFRKIDEFVSWCEKHNLNIVLNLHKAVGNYCDIQEKVQLLDDAELQNRFVALWLEFERRYHDKPGLAFELLNEVRNVDPEKWNVLADRALKAIREKNPSRWVVIGSTCWNSAGTLDKLRLWDDDKVVYTYHMYSPFEFTHQRGVLQAGPLYYNRVMEYPSTDIERYRDFNRLVNGSKDGGYKGLKAIDRQFVRNAMHGAHKFVKAHPDKILWNGEFGTIRHAPPASRVAYMRDVISTCKEWGIPYCVWNYLSTPNDGNRFSLVDDDTRKILSQELLDACLGKELTAGAKQDKFYGWDRYTADVDGVKTVLVTPKKAAEGRPWIWRARFFGHQPQLDIALLEQGFHLAYVEVGNLYGSPEAVKRWDAGYKYFTEKHGLSKKPVLEGMSRGGLIVFNWAKKNPDKVAAIYVDAPVCDFKDWPRNKSKGDWAKCLKAYGLTEEQALAYNDNPKDNLDALAAAGVPVLAVCGATDTVVEMDKNINVLAENYRKLGGNIRVVSKPGNEHHPHSLKDPALIANFLMANTLGKNDYIIPRDGIGNAIGAFERGKATVAFLGGSIVEMNGFRPLTCAGLKKLYPKCDFTFVDAGISSTCSDTGAFRLQRDVLSKGKIDLLFVEFATNDSGDGTYPNAKKSLRAVEGIVRQARAANPKTDVVLVYTANEGSTASYMSNAKTISAEMVAADNEKFDNTRGVAKFPPQVEAFEKVAAHYGLASINFGRDMAERMRHLEFDWKQFGGVHPAPMGNKFYAEAILQLIKGQRGKSADRAHAPVKPLCDMNYENARFVDVSEAKIVKGWNVGVPDWAKIEGSKRERYLKEKMIFSDEPGAEFSFKFNGRVIGLWMTAGIDAGKIEHSVDGGEWKTADTFHSFSSSLHYPYTLTLEDELASGDHEIKVRVLSEKNAASKGNAVRIMSFCVN